MDSNNQIAKPDELDGLEELEGVEEDPGRDAILFAIGNEYLAIPLDEIAEIHELEGITPLPMAPSFIEGVINVHGILATVISLDRILHISEVPVGNLLTRLIPERGGIAIRVESSLGMVKYSILEEVTRDMGQVDNQISFIEGVFRSGDKLISLINPSKLCVWIDGALAKGED